jgi:hypothetical protein
MKKLVATLLILALNLLGLYVLFGSAAATPQPQSQIFLPTVSQSRDNYYATPEDITAMYYKCEHLPFPYEEHPEPIPPCLVHTGFARTSTAIILDGKEYEVYWHEWGDVRFIPGREYTIVVSLWAVEDMVFDGTYGDTGFTDCTVSDYWNCQDITKLQIDPLWWYPHLNPA